MRVLYVLAVGAAHFVGVDREGETAERRSDANATDTGLPEAYHWVVDRLAGLAQLGKPLRTSSCTNKAANQPAPPPLRKLEWGLLVRAFSAYLRQEDIYKDIASPFAISTKRLVTRVHDYTMGADWWLQPEHNMFKDMLTCILDDERGDDIRLCVKATHDDAKAIAQDLVTIMTGVSLSDAAVTASYFSSSKPQQVVVRVQDAPGVFSRGLVLQMPENVVYSVRKKAERSLRRLLPGRAPLKVVLDLDETLVHAESVHSPGIWSSTDLERTTPYDTFRITICDGSNMVVVVRPGVKDFLAWLQKDDRFEVSVYTSGVRAYGNAVVAALFDPPVPTLARENNLLVGKQLYKDLETVGDLARVVLVDNSERVMLQPDNALIVEDFLGMSDVVSAPSRSRTLTMARVRQALEQLAAEDDVRPYLRQLRASDDTANPSEPTGTLSRSPILTQVVPSEANIRRPDEIRDDHLVENWMATDSGGFVREDKVAG